MKKALALGAALALGVTACGGGGSSDGMEISSDPFCQQVMPKVQAYMAQARKEHPTPDDPRYGGTVVVASYGEFSDGMNSAVSTDASGTQQQEFVNLMTLIKYDKDLNPEPYLAKSWDVAPDDLSITFHLRDDVMWHDGVPTTAKDVAFTWDVVTDPATAFPNASFWDHYVKGPEGVEVLDDYTVRIHLKEKESEFMDPFRSLAMLPEHLLGDVPHDQLKLHPFGTQCPVGNGPFVFMQHRPQDRWVFAANPGFPQGLGGRPFVDRYIYRDIEEQTTLLTELLTEDVDVYDGMGPDQAQKVIDNPTTHLVAYPTRQYVFVGWNARRPQLADPRVRRAITMGINRDEIVKAIELGYATVAHSGVPPFHWAYMPDSLPVLSYDPEAAKKLLDEAGWKDRDGDGVRESADGTPLSFTIKYNEGNRQRQDVAEIMQSQLAKIGVEAKPQVVEWATLLEQINNPKLRDFDGVVMGWVVEFKLDDTDLFDSKRIEQPYAWSGTQNPKIDKLLGEISTTVDRTKAKHLWLEYQKAIIQEQPYTYFYFPDRLVGVNNRVKGAVMDARGEWQNIKDWYLDPVDR
jgi:peptide/nickel transport system substrate-binding protein